MRILSIYENGSGQKLNLQKTSNFFFFFFFFFFSSVGIQVWRGGKKY
jgi:hypothetical protein